MFISCAVCASESTIDESVETLPKGFRPSSFKDVWTKLILKKKPEKKEYERTEQYEARLAAWDENQKNKAPNTLWLYIPNINNNNFTIDYNADLERFDIAIRPMVLNAYGQGNGKFLMRYNNQNLGSYTATNRFGAAYKVQKEITYSDQIVFSGNSKSEKLDSDYVLYATTSEAKDIKNNIALLLHGSIDTPYATEIRGRITPDADYLYDTTTIERNVYFKPEGVWIVNRKTGAIYYKLDWSYVNWSSVN